MPAATIFRNGDAVCRRHTLRANRNRAIECDQRASVSGGLRVARPASAENVISKS